MEDNHYVIKDVHPSNELIARVPMTSNFLFPLRIVPENTKDAFKVESKEEVVYYDKKEKDSVDFRLYFKQKFRMIPGYGISDLDI